MKRDDMGMRIDEIRELATKYSKPELQRMVQMGIVEPQKAVMAGMMIDRIAKSAMQPPQTTVAEDVLGQQQAPQGMMAAPGAPPPSAGVAGLPSGIQNMAGGGIVAFADGGYPEDMVRASRAADSALAGMPSQDGLPALPGGYRMRETALPDRSNIATEVGAVGEAERAAGYDPEMYKRMREEELGRREELGKRKEEAKGEALLMAGLGLMGARRGQEFEMFSKAASQALSQYKGDVAEIRKSENEIRKAARDLEMAENAAKKSKSEKGLDRLQKKQDAYDAAAARRDETYNQTVVKLADMFQHEKGIDKQLANQMAIAVLNNQTQLKTTGMQIAAQKSIHGTSDMERINAEYERRQKTEGQEAADAYKARMLQFKGIEARSGVTDDDLQKAYFKQLELLFGKEKKDFLQRYPTYKEFIDAQRSRVALSGGSTQPSGQVDTRNPLLAQ